MIVITWQILLAIAGVIAGFVVTERILERRGYRRRVKRVSIPLDELPGYLKRKFLANSAVIVGKRKIVVEVEDEELEFLLNVLSSSGGDEIVVISGSDFAYITKKDDVVVFAKGKFISMRDFAELWLTVRQSLRGAGL